MDLNSFFYVKCRLSKLLERVSKNPCGPHPDDQVKLLKRGNGGHKVTKNWKKNIRQISLVRCVDISILQFDGFFAKK